MVIPQQQTAAAMFAGQKPLLQRQPVVIGQLGGIFQGLINVCVHNIKSSFVDHIIKMLEIIYLYRINLLVLHRHLTNIT